MLKHADKQLAGLLPRLVGIRRRLHANPEIKFKEFATAELIERELAEGGVPCRRVARTGVVALIKGKRPGKTIALRADIDALRLKELTGLPYASANDCMHACGHDGHTAVLLGAAWILAGLTDRFRGCVKLIFQPGEEGAAGARKLCRLGVMQRPKVAAIFGLHCFNDAPVGCIGVREGPMTACADQFYITVQGAGAHGAYPHKAVDPIVAAARIVEGLQGIVSREVPPMKPAVVTVGTIHGGTAENIIPVEVKMSGTLRSCDQDVRELLIASVGRIARATAEASGAQAVVRVQRGYPATVNDKALTDVVRRAGRAALGAGKVLELAEPTMGAEDFSFYLDHAPGCFFRLGAGDPPPRDGAGKQAPAHSPYFDFNDRAIAPGVKVFVTIVKEMLGVRH